MKVGIAILGIIAAAVLLVSGCTKQTPKVYHVGILSGLDYFASTSDGFKAKMTELGYIEGKNIVYDVQKTNFDMAEYKSILNKFVTDKVDLIFVFPTEAAVEAKATTQGTGIPMVFAHSGIEGVDLVNSLREPGGNITGVRYPGQEQAAKNLEILVEIMPQAKRILLAYQRGFHIDVRLEALRPVLEVAGVTLIEVPADNATELEAELKGLGDIDIDAILVVPEPLLTAPDAFVVMGKFAAEHKIPIGGGPLSMGGYESIFNLPIDNVAVGKLAAPLADKILRGIPAATTPVVTPEIGLIINYKASQKLGLNVNEGLLARADEIIR